MRRQGSTGCRLRRSGHELPDRWGLGRDSSSEAMRMIEPLTRSALEIDPMLAERTHPRDSSTRWRFVDDAKIIPARSSSNRLLVPYVDFIWSTLVPWGRLDESLKLLEAALEADPVSRSPARPLVCPTHRRSVPGGARQCPAGARRRPDLSFRR